MFRLILLVTAVFLLIALPLLAIPSAAEQEGFQGAANPTFSVVSHRGVRVRLAQQPDPPADTAPAPSAAEPAAADDTEDAVEPAAEADATADAEPAAPPADEEADPFEDEAPAADPGVTPDICGPVRARIDDVSKEPGPVHSQKSDRPLTKEAHGPVRAKITDVKQKDHSCNVCQRGDMHKDVKGGGGGKGHSVKGHGARYRGRLAGSAHGGHGILSRGSGGCAGGACGASGGVCDICGGGHGHGVLAARKNGEDFCCCQMYQHYAYYPAIHGHYYFRPYNHLRIPEQQRMAAEWGEDPRHPYANDLFQIVYADYLREQEEAAEPAIEVPTPVDPTPPAVGREEN